MAAAAAAAEASSGRLAEDTPSQTTATVAVDPSGRLVAATAKESSLRWWRSPRSLTAATLPSSSSWWSRSRGWACPQCSQYPSVSTRPARHATQVLPPGAAGAGCAAGSGAAPAGAVAAGSAGGPAVPGAGSYAWS